jgi:arylsulfatase A-like enzyme
MPFLVRWPGRIRPGESDALVCQVDLLASLAALTGQKLAENAAPDSFNVLPALLGEAKTGREHLIVNGNGLRLGPWKFIEGNPKGAKAGPVQLYNLAEDPEEATNVAERHAQRVAEMAALLKQLRAAGRSRQ